MSPSIVQSIWRYRGFILGTVRREFEARYRNSLLGAAWTVLQPLAMITVYTVVFSKLMSARLPGMEGPYAYSTFLCSGLLTWGLFAEILQRGQSVFLENGNIIKKLNFPRICLPAITVLNALVNFGITFSIFLVFLLITGNFPGWIVLYTIPVLAVEIAFAIGTSVVAGVLNVFFRDVGQFFVILLQFWFWFTPIVYSITTLSPAARNLIHFNPMTPLAQAYQNIFVYGLAPSWPSIVHVAILAVVMCALGFFLFRRHAGDMVDEL
jgi:lipopolysaccharide transport system permease protein